MAPITTQFKTTGVFAETLPSTIGSYVDSDHAYDGAKNKVTVVIDTQPDNSNNTWAEVRVVNPEGAVIKQGKATMPVPWKLDGVTLAHNGDVLTLEAHVHTYGNPPRKRDVMYAQFPGFWVPEAVGAPVTYEDKCVLPANRPYFHPNAGLTRAQVSKMISKAIGWNEPPGEQIFEDVPPTHPDFAEIQRMARRGIIGGYKCKP